VINQVVHQCIQKYILTLLQHMEEVIPVYGLERLCIVPGVTARVNVVRCMAVNIAESLPIAPSLAALSRFTYSLSLMSPDDARFTRQGLLFNCLEKLINMHIQYVLHATINCNQTTSNYHYSTKMVKNLH